MKFLLLLFIFAVIIYICTREDKWGCLGAFIMVMFFLLLNILGFLNMVKSCSDSVPSVDYYESPR